MNYSPIDYTALYGTIEDSENKASELTSVRFSSNNIEEAENIVYDLEKEIEPLGNNLLQLAKDANGYLQRIIVESYQDKLEQYVKLVNLGYEQDVFPFNEWFTCVHDKSWLFNNTKNLAKTLTDIEDNGNIHIITLLMDNIVQLSKNSIYFTNEQKVVLLNSCFSLTENIPSTYKEDFIYHFISNEKIYDNYIYKLINDKPIDLFDPVINTKLGHYLNYLYYQPNKNEVQIDKVWQMISQIENPDLLKEISSVLIAYNINTSILSWNKGTLLSISLNNIEALFEKDINNNGKLTPFIAKELRQIQSNIKNNTKQFETLENITTYLEKGYHAYYLDSILPNKNVEKKKQKI